MPRTLSTEAMRSVLSQYTSEVWLQLLTIYNVDGDVLIRIVDNPEAITSRGNEYLAAHWDLHLPPSDPDRLPVAQFRFSAATRELIEDIRSLTTSISIVHELVLASSPDTIEVGPIRYTLKDVQYNANSIEGTLGFEDILSETYPKDTFVPSKFPGLFQ